MTRRSFPVLCLRFHSVRCRTGVHHAIRARHPRECSTRLDERSSDERVFLQIYREAARAAADAADARRRAGIPLGPLDGVIVSIKDLFDVAGETTTAGSIVLRDAAPAQRDATVVRRLRQAGAVVVGKTNMVEFAFAAIGLNPHYGTPGNATDSSRIPGGSSSGAGVSVAEGTSAVSIGSDTGGSVRFRPPSMASSVSSRRRSGSRWKACSRSPTASTPSGRWREASRTASMPMRSWPERNPAKSSLFRSPDCGSASHAGGSSVTPSRSSRKRSKQI